MYHELFRTLERCTTNLEGERTGFPWAHKRRSTATFFYADFLRFFVLFEKGVILYILRLGSREETEGRTRWRVALLAHILQIRMRGQRMGVKSQPLSAGEIGCDRDGHTTETHLKVRKN
jgi:hypothetical protein